MKKGSNKSPVIMLAVLTVLAVMLSVYNDAGERNVEVTQYCELVQLWNDSQGENGHPDYRGQAAKLCNHN